MSILALAAAGIAGGAPTFTVAAGTYTDPVFGDGSYSLESDGDIVVNTSIPSDVGDWISPKGRAPGAYEARATLNSGTLSTGTTGSWLALTSTRTWTCANTASANLTIDIRDGAGTTVATGTVIIVGGGTP
jgi:hypothetical protein